MVILKSSQTMPLTVAVAIPSLVSSKLKRKVLPKSLLKQPPLEANDAMPPR